MRPIYFLLPNWILQAAFLNFKKLSTRLVLPASPHLTYGVIFNEMRLDPDDSVVSWFFGVGPREGGPLQNPPNPETPQVHQNLPNREPKVLAPLPNVPHRHLPSPHKVTSTNL